MDADKISKELNWLLEFINLGSTPGVYNLKWQLRQMRYYDSERWGDAPLKPGTKVLSEPQKDDLEIKRPQIEPSKINLSSSQLEFCNLLGNVQKGDHSFYVNDKGELIPAGDSVSRLSVTEYKTFFSEFGIPPIKEGISDFYIRGDMSSLAMHASTRNTIFRGADMSLNHKDAYKYLNYFHLTSIHFIWYLLLETRMEQEERDIRPWLVPRSGFVIDIKPARDAVYGFYMSNQKKIDYRKLSLDRNIAFEHDGSLPLAIFAFLLDLAHNHKELHKRLWQCQCCGKFEFEVTEGVRGGKRKHCSDKCKVRFNLAARKADNASKANSRKSKKQTAKKEIIDFLRKHDYTEEDAEEEYENENNLHPTNTASLKSFQNTFFKGFH